MNTAQNRLEGSIRQLADQQDDFKIRLGLPPDVVVDIDNSFLAPFELIDTKILDLAEELKTFAKTDGPGLLPDSQENVELPSDAPPFATLKSYIASLTDLRDRIRDGGLEQVKNDFVPVREILDATSGDLDADIDGRTFYTKDERDRVIRDVARDLRLYRLNERDFLERSQTVDLLRNLMDHESQEALMSSLDTNGDMMISQSELPEGWSAVRGIGPEKKSPTVTSPPEPITEGLAAPKADATALTADEFAKKVGRAALQVREDMLKITQGLQVVQAGLRVEVIPLNKFEIEGIEGPPTIEQVVDYSLENRHDLMNARAEVMDARRRMEVTANALKSALNLNVSGDVDLDGGNATDSVNVSLDFKAPLDHVRQRNNYNAAQIAYQRARRSYMDTEDNIKRAVRASWRQLQVARQRLEIDRQTVRNAALQYDNVVTDVRGSDSLSLLNALNAVLDAQNSLISDWISYETSRLNIFRDMGIMSINQSGIWEDRFYLQDGPGVTDTLTVPEVLILENPASPVPPEPQVQQVLPVIEVPSNE